MSVAPTIANLSQYAKQQDTPLCALRLTPKYDENKKRVSKGQSIPHTGWNKRGYTNKHFTTVPGAEGLPYAWMLDLRKLGMYVVDIDVKGQDTGKDVLKPEVYQRLYDNCAYVVESGSKGLHFYFHLGGLEEGDILSKNIKADCADWFQGEGEVDFIIDAIISEFSTYQHEGITYQYQALKGSIADVIMWEDGWACHRGFFVRNPKKEKEEQAERKRQEKAIKKKLALNQEADEAMEEAEEEVAHHMKPVSHEEVTLHLANIARHSSKQFSYKKWYEMAQTLKNVYSEEQDEDAFSLFDAFSQLCPSYDGEGKTRKFWNGIRRRSDGVVRTLGSILYLSKEANPKEYQAIRKGFHPLGYYATKELFEETHFYFVPSNGVAEVSSLGSVKVYGLEHASTYMNTWICYDKEGHRTKAPFLTTWLKDPTRRMIYSFVAKKAEECSSTEWPLFTSFHYQTLTEAITEEQRKDAIEKFQDLTSAVCNDEEPVSKYIMDTFTHIIQQPFKKNGKIIAFASPDEGTGKDTLMVIIQKVLGNHATAHYTSSEQFWNTHDTLSIGKPFVYLEEACSRQNKANEGRLKARVTASDISVNPKGLDPYMVPNIGRTFQTTNETQPFNTSETDRRGLIIKPSTRLTKQDWTTFYKQYVEQDWFIQAVGEWLEKRDISNWDASKSMPTTEIKKELQELSVKPEQLFMEQWEEKEWVSSSDLYKDYRAFCDENSYHYCQTPNSFGMRILHYKGRYFKTFTTARKEKYYCKTDCTVDFEEWYEERKKPVAEPAGL
jgi:hypothetical protein